MAEDGIIDVEVIDYQDNEEEEEKPKEKVKEEKDLTDK